MAEWVNDHLEAVLGWGLMVGGFVFGFVRGVWKTRSDHDQLRKEFDSHMSEARPLMATVIEVRERVDSIEERMEEKFETIMTSLREGREDVNKLNETVLRFLEDRRFGGLRAVDKG